MPLLNPKNNFKLSRAYIGAFYGTNALIRLHDESFPLRRGTRFTDRRLNLFKSIHAVRKQGRSAVKNILAVLHDLTHSTLLNCTPFTTQTIATVILQPCIKSGTLTRPSKISTEKHRPVVQDYYNLANAWQAIRPKFKHFGGLPLFHSIESIFLDPSNLYVHLHGLVATTNPVGMQGMEDYLDLVASKFGYRVKIKPLQNRYGNTVEINPSTSRRSANIDAIKAFTYYSYKQYALPVDYGKDKAHPAYRTFSKMTRRQQRLAIVAILNSTHDNTLRGHISYKQWSKSMVRVDLADVRFTMRKHHVVKQYRLFKPANIKSIRPAGYHTYHVQWRLARDSAVLNSIKVTPYLLNALYIAVKNCYQADCIRQYVISALGRFEQNKNRLFKADFANGDRLRATGTPP